MKSFIIILIGMMAVAAPPSQKGIKITSAEEPTPVQVTEEPTLTVADIVEHVDTLALALYGVDLTPAELTVITYLLTILVKADATILQEDMDTAVTKICSAIAPYIPGLPC